MAMVSAKFKILIIWKLKKYIVGMVNINHAWYVSIMNLNGNFTADNNDDNAVSLYKDEKPSIQLCVKSSTWFQTSIQTNYFKNLISKRDSLLFELNIEIWMKFMWE